MNIKCIFIQSLAAQCALLTWRRRYTCQRFKVRFFSCLLFLFFFLSLFWKRFEDVALIKERSGYLKTRKKKRLRKHFEFRYNNNIIDSIVYRLPSSVHRLQSNVYCLSSNFYRLCFSKCRWE